MKKILKYLAIFTASILVFTACNDDELDWKKLEYQAATNAFTGAITITSIQDSSFIANFQPAVLGSIYYIMQDSSEADITDNIALIEDGEFLKVETLDEVISVQFSDLVQNTTYEIFAVNVNASGVPSAIHEKILVTTIDTYAPVLLSFTPAGQDPRALANQPIVLTFDEPIASYDATKTLWYHSYFYGVDYVVPEDSITISGNQVIVNLGLLKYNDYCFLDIEEGAFLDYNGNVNEAIESGVVGGYLVGIWFRVEKDPATQLAGVFENFLGDYVCTDYLNADSVTVDYGPYGVTVTENTATTEPYDVIISNFWAWGDANTFVVTFNTNYTLTSNIQKLAVGMDNLYGPANYGDEFIYAKIWSADPYMTPIGEWSYTDFSFNFAVSFFNNYYGQLYDDLYQEYVKDDGTKTLKTNRPFEIFNLK